MVMAVSIRSKKKHGIMQSMKLLQFCCIYHVLSSFIGLSVHAFHKIDMKSLLGRVFEVHLSICAIHHLQVQAISVTPINVHFMERCASNNAFTSSRCWELIINHLQAITNAFSGETSVSQ